MNKDIYLNCSYIPPELFAAAGLNPVRFWPSKIGQDGQNLIPVDLCPYIKAILSQLYNEKNIVIANSCDGMRRLYDVFDVQSKNSFLLEVPQKSGKSEVNYYYQQLQSLLASLHIEYNKKYRLKLRRVIEKYNKQRIILKKIQFKKPATVLYKSIKIYTNNDRGNLKNLLQEGKEDIISNSNPKILLTGSCLLDGQIINMIAKNNLMLMALDSCLGERSFDFSVNTAPDRDPLRDLAETYLQKSICPRCMEPDSRLQEINKMVVNRDIDGIIYFMPKFCDQAGYDFKLIKDRAREKNIPVLNLEGEYKSGQSGQLQTRVEAFRESLVMQRGVEDGFKI